MLPKKVNVLCACEESQAVTIECRKHCINAFSCDLQVCSGGHPEWHILGDCLEVIDCEHGFYTLDGVYHYVDKWDFLICFPPCTYLSRVANRSFKMDSRRFYKSIDAALFFFRLYFSNIDKVLLENPVGYLNTVFPPTQIIHPYYFALDYLDKDNFYKKETCLWLKNISPLKYRLPIDIPSESWVYSDAVKGSNRQVMRSKTFPGVAKAIVNQVILERSF